MSKEEAGDGARSGLSQGSARFGKSRAGGVKVVEHNYVASSDFGLRVKNVHGIFEIF